MKLGMMAAGLGLAMAMSVASADAAPLGTALFQTEAANGGAQVLLVRGGCGWGAHRTWYGNCSFNHGWRGRARARRW